jgi:alginate O-acetyltransferase complex protein AlgI
MGNKLLLCATALPALRLLWRSLRSGKQKQLLLLLAGYLFYAGWQTWLVSVLIFSSLMNYILGRYLRRRPSARHLWLGLSFNLALLALFKYLPSFGWFLSPCSLSSASVTHLVLPVGMSF